METDVRNIGLRGVLVANTLICKVEPTLGKLLYRGYNVLDLAKNSTFEEIVHLLLYKRLPRKNELSELNEKMKRLREPPEYLTKCFLDMPRTAPTMSVLQSSISLVECFECEATTSKDDDLEIALKLISMMPSIIAYWFRIKKQLAIVKPSDLNHASNFLYMLTGEKPQQEIAEIFDECLILHAEHSFNASTFAAREVASTGASIYASVSAAVGALSGELHGGASAKVMEMIEDIGDVNRVEEWIKNRLDQGKRIMGMGHAVYRTTDPRAEALKERSERLGKIKNELKWFEITRDVEKYARTELLRRRKLDIYANVDLYTPSIYHVMGIPKELFTPIFALARVPGWSAHIIEEKLAEAQPKPVLYRPEAKYVGNYCGPEECAFTPIEDRP